MPNISVSYSDHKGTRASLKYPFVGHIFLSLCIFWLLSPSSEASAIEKVTAFSLYGDPKYPSGFSHFEYVNPSAPKSGKITLPALGTFDTLNPYVLKGISASRYSGNYGITELNEPLMVGTGYYLESGDEPQTAYCLLCIHLEYPSDYSWVIFQLDPQAQFHNGTALTAEDVEFSFQLLLSDQAHPMYANNLANVAKVEALSPHRVKFSFKQSGLRTSILRAGELPVMSKKHWQNHKFGFSSGTAQPLSGPYRVKEFVLGNYLTLERMDDFWSKDHPVYQGMFNFDEVRIEFYRDRTVAFEAFKSGGLDFWIEYVSKNWVTAYDFPAVAQGRVIKQALPHTIPSGTQAFFMNMRRPLFQSLEVRKALSLLFDYHWINKNIFSSAYKRSQTHYPNSEMGSRGLPLGAELALLDGHRNHLPPALFEEEFKFELYDTTKKRRSALCQAIALLRQSGWDYKNKLLVNNETGEPFKFEILIDSPSFQRVLLPYVKQLKKAGMQVDIRIVDPAQYKVRLDSFDFDMTVYVLPQAAYPGPEQGLYFHSEQADVRGSRNLSGIKNPVVDALVERVAEAKSHDDLVATTRALDRVLLWNYYMIPHWHLDYHRLAYRNRFQRPEHSPDLSLGFQTWWLKN